MFKQPKIFKKSWPIKKKLLSLYNKIKYVSGEIGKHGV
jgi:hypothetical protein